MTRSILANPPIARLSREELSAWAEPVFRQLLVAQHRRNRRVGSDHSLADTPDLLWKRTANASSSFWSQTVADNVCPPKTVVGSASGLCRRRPGGCGMGWFGN